MKSRPTPHDCNMPSAFSPLRADILAKSGSRIRASLAVSLLRIRILNATSAVGISRFPSRDRPIECACCGHTPAIRPGIALAGAAAVAAAFAVEPARTADVRVADLLATGALGPGLPQPAPARRAGDSGLAPVIPFAQSRAA